MHHDLHDHHSNELVESHGPPLIGVGLGAAMAGAAVGTIAGVIAGPAAFVAGAAIGAFVGAAAGGAAEGYVDPEIEDAYWREHFHERLYVQPGLVYSDYEQAYRFGRESQSAYRDFEFSEVEHDLADAWESQRELGGMTWEQARPAVLDAWRRVEAAHELENDA
jgi:hypothetical protein